MVNAVWPATLPQLVQVSGYEETHQDNVLRTKMSVGQKSRVVDTHEIRMFTVTLLIDVSQKSTLRTFYRDTLAYGVLPFDWTEFDDPNTVATYKMQGPPRITARDGQTFIATLQLIAD